MMTTYPGQMHYMQIIIAKENKTETQVISFYSYKGGVGRTIALIETAYILQMQEKGITA